jgi:hypothetical protein
MSFNQFRCYKWLITYGLLVGEQKHIRLQIIHALVLNRSRDSSLCVVNRLRAGIRGSGILFLAGTRDVSFPHIVQTYSGPKKHPIHWVPEVKRSEVVADTQFHLMQRLKIRKTALSPSPPYVFMSSYLFQHRENVTSLCF